MNERTLRVAREAGEVHHVVYRITDRADDDGASFTHRLTRHSERGDVLGAIPIRSHLVHALVDCERAAPTPPTPRSHGVFYAVRVLARFS